MKVLAKIVAFHARAFNWCPDVDIAQLCEMAWSRGYYLRTKIRAAIEHLDQLLQYGDTGVITAGDLEQETRGRFTVLGQRAAPPYVGQGNHLRKAIAIYILS